jgi:hypothetical protein
MAGLVSRGHGMHVAAMSTSRGRHNRGRGEDHCGKEEGALYVQHGWSEWMPLGTL